MPAETLQNTGSFVLMQVLADKGLAEAGLELDSITSCNIKELAKSAAGSGAKNGAVGQNDVRLLLLVKFWDRVPESVKDDFFDRLIRLLSPSE